MSVLVILGLVGATLAGVVAAVASDQTGLAVVLAAVFLLAAIGVPLARDRTQRARQRGRHAAGLGSVC